MWILNYNKRWCHWPSIHPLLAAVWTGARAIDSGEKECHTDSNTIPDMERARVLILWQRDDESCGANGEPIRR